MIRFTLLVLAALLIASCAQSPPPRGSAQDQAASATGRAEASTSAADTAAVDAAAKSAQADALAAQAVKTPTPQLIEAAANARANAMVALAVSSALRRVADSSTAAAVKAAEDARKEREAEAAATDLRRWVSVTRWVGGAAVFLGALVGGALGYLVGPAVGLRAGIILAGSGVAVAAFGSTVRWLPVIVLAAVVLVVAEWFYHHRKHVTAPPRPPPATIA